MVSRQRMRGEPRVPMDGCRSHSCELRCLSQVRRPNKFGYVVLTRIVTHWSVAKSGNSYFPPRANSDQLAQWMQSTGFASIPACAAEMAVSGTQQKMESFSYKNHVSQGGASSMS